MCSTAQYGQLKLQMIHGGWPRSTENWTSSAPIHGAVPNTATTLHALARSRECALLYWASVPLRSVAQSCLTLCDPMQNTRPPCPSPTPEAYSDPCCSSRWCHPTISSSVVPFSSCLQSFPASVSFPMSQFFASGGQSIGVSASPSVLPKNIRDWFPLGLTGWIAL